MTSPIAFVCLHGSAKSFIAAEVLNRTAAARGLALRAASLGVEPDAELPPHVVAGLREKGYDVAGRVPVAATAAALAAYPRVIAFGCDAGPLVPGKTVEQWAECPAVSDGFEPAWAWITARVEALLREG